MTYNWLYNSRSISVVVLNPWQYKNCLKSLEKKKNTNAGPFQDQKNQNPWYGVRAILIKLLRWFKRAARIENHCSHGFNLKLKTPGQGVSVRHCFHVETRQLWSAVFLPEHINQGDYLTSFCAISVCYKTCVWIQVKSDFFLCTQIKRI